MDEIMDDDVGQFAGAVTDAGAVSESHEGDSEDHGDSRFDPTLLNEVFGSRIPTKLAPGRRVYGVISDTPRRLRVPLSSIR